MGRAALGVGLAVGMLVLAARPARAEELAWRLEGATVRYDLTVEARPTPEPLGLTPLPLVLLRQDDLAGARVPRRALEDAGDVLWRYCLALPAGDVPARGADVPIDEPLTVGTAAWRARGQHVVRLRGKKAQVRTTAALTLDKAPAYGAAGGTLTIDKTFDLKAGRLELATWTLELDVVAPGPPPTTARGTWTGRVAPGADPAGDDARALHGRIGDAIARGAAWLVKASNERLNGYKAAKSYGGQALGSQALLTFALLRSGVPLAEVDHHFEWLHRQPWRETYSVSLYIMALEARSVVRLPVGPQARLRSVVRYQRGPLPPRDKELIAQAARWLVAARKPKEGWWSYFGPAVEAGSPERAAGPARPGPLGHDGTKPADGGDRSNSQFAILALHAAMAAGADVPGEVWEEVLDELTKAQQEDGPVVALGGSSDELAGTSPLAWDPRDEPDAATTTERPRGALTPEERLAGKARGWGYSNARRTTATEAYGSMTGAGVSSLAVAREGLEAANRLTGERARAALVGLRDGLAWFAANFDLSRNVNRGAAWWFYYLYSVEKAMDLAGVERLGDHEWWREGALELLARQAPNGSWGADPNDTAFALLFLNRATLPAKLEVGEVKRVATGQADASAWDRVVLPDQRGQIALRQVLQALAQATTPAEVKDRLDLAQAGLAAFDPEARPRLTPELKVLLGSPTKKVEKWAREQLLAVAGTDDPAALDAFAARFERLRRACEAQDAAAIPDVQATLVDVAATPPLKRAALAAVGRLRAVEAVGEVVALLDHRDLGVRQAAWTQLQGVAGGAVHPYDPTLQNGARKKQVDAWRAWWQAEGPPRVTAERARRLAADLAVEARAAAAAKELEAIGRPAVRALIDALRPEASRPRAHALLRRITGQAFPADVEPWMGWWEKQ